MTDELTPLATQQTHDLVKSMKEVKGQNWNVYTTSFHIGCASPETIRTVARERGLKVSDNVQRICATLIELGVMEQRGEGYYVVVDRLPVKRDSGEKKLAQNAKNAGLIKAQWDLCVECWRQGLPMPTDEKIPELLHIMRDFGRKSASTDKTRAQNKAREKPKEAPALFIVPAISPESLAALPAAPPPPPPPPPTHDAPPSLIGLSEPLPTFDNGDREFVEAEL